MLQKNKETSQYKRVLLAEDSVITQDILCLALKNSGHHIEVANNAREAVALLCAQPFDIALIDFHLPDRNGFELVREYFRTSTQSHSPRLVALSGDASEVLQVDKAANHFDLILAKPFMVSDLVDVIESPKSAPHPMRVRDSILANEAQRPDAVLPNGHDFHLIYFPFDFRASFKNAVSMSIAKNGAVDALILDEVPNESEAMMLTKIKGLGSATHIDRTEKMGVQTDFSIKETSVEANIIEFLEHRRDARKNIHPSHLFCKTIEENLVVSAFLKTEPMQPQINLASKFGATYNHILPGEMFRTYAEKLVQIGAFSRFQSIELIRCPMCESARLYPHNLKTKKAIDFDEVFCTDCQTHNLSEKLVIENLSQYEPSTRTIKRLSKSKSDAELIV